MTNGFDSTSYTHYTDTGSKTITTSGGDSAAAFDNTHTREDGGEHHVSAAFWSYPIFA